MLGLGALGRGITPLSCIVREGAALYARVSTLDQRPEAQLAELREHCARRGVNVGGVEGICTPARWVPRASGALRHPQESRTASEFCLVCIICWPFPFCLQTPRSNLLIDKQIRVPGQVTQAGGSLHLALMCRRPAAA